MKLPETEEALERPVVTFWRLAALVRVATLGGLAAAVGLPALLGGGGMAPLGWVVLAGATVMGLPAIVTLLTAGVRWRRFRFGVSDAFLRVRHGWLSRHEKVIPIPRVQHLDVDEGFFERLFGLATLEVYTAGGTAGDVSDSRPDPCAGAGPPPSHPVGVGGIGDGPITGAVWRRRADVDAAHGSFGRRPDGQRPPGGHTVTDAPREHGQAAEAPQSSRGVVLEGGLHPASFLLRLDRFGRFAFFIGLALFFRGSTDLGPMLGPIVLFMSLGLVGPVLELVSFRYRLTPTELTVRSGVFARSERRIPVDRIHDLGIEQTFLRRVLGLVKVTVETSSTGGAEASLDALDPATADRLRGAIERLGGMSEQAPTEPRSTAAQPDGQVGGRRDPGALVYEAGVGALLARGLTDNRAGLFVLAAASIAQLFATVTGTPLELFLADRWVDNAGRILRAPRATWVALAAVVVAAAYVFGWVVGALLSVASYHGFSLRERRGLFVRRYGLFTRRTLSLPARRIQLVELSQSPVRRLFDAGTLRVESAGSVAGEDARGGTDAGEGTALFVPFARLATLRGVAGRLVPGAASSELPWEKTSPSIVPRTAVRGLWLGGAASFLLYRGALALDFAPLPIGALAGPVLVGALLFAALGLLRYRALRFALTGDVLAVRDGALARVHTFVPLPRIEAVTLDASPIDRLRRIARVTVHVLGGAGVTVPNVPRDRAAALLGELGGSLVEPAREVPGAGAVPA